jgi:hypothetical protein
VQGFFELKKIKIKNKRLKYPSLCTTITQSSRLDPLTSPVLVHPNPINCGTLGEA